MHTRHCRALVAVAFLLVVSPAFAQERAMPLAFEEVPGQLEVKFGANRVLLYAFGTNRLKPYVRELYAFNGLNVLRDAPADHLHHHGLMYAIRVNGVNFWEETGQPGHQRSIRIVSRSTGKSPRGLPQATFAHLIHWVAHTNAAIDDVNAALLIERRTIATTIDEAQREVAVGWFSDFEVGPAAAKAKLTGSGYNGLGLRLPTQFDHVAKHQNSENLPYSVEGQWDVTPAKWSVVAGTADGRAASIALFSTPANKGDARFFTMLNPFTYLSVTQNLEKQPIEYARGHKFSIRYLLTVYSEEKSPEYLNRRYAQWLADAK